MIGLEGQLVMSEGAQALLCLVTIWSTNLMHVSGQKKQGDLSDA